MKATNLCCIFFLSFLPTLVSAQEEDVYSALRYAYTEEEMCNAELRIANGTPRIDLDYQVVLSTAMSKALNKVEPDFKPWPLSHFHPDVRSTYKFTDERTERFRRAHQSPAVVIGDFNDDGKNDAIMIGYDKTHEIGVKVLSKGDNYEVAVSSKTKHNELSKDFDPYKPVCHFYYIELVEKGREIKSDYEEKPLKLKADAERYVGEKTSGISYYENGEWHGYVTGD